MKEGLFHLFFTFPSIPSKTKKKKNARKIVHYCFFPKGFSVKKIVINFVYVLFPPDLENFKSKGVETFPPLTFFSYPTLLAIFDLLCKKNLNTLC